MALTEYQKSICLFLAENRIQNGESYVAGGAALNLLMKSDRLSRDIDLFHDTAAALQASWDADRLLLEQSGYHLDILHERTGYIEVIVRKNTDSVLFQWTRDSAFRFFPLIQHEILGLSLHPFDLATNKTLALAGRLEIRDWIDLINCHDRIQPLGYLAWAACGKDPGFSPGSILEQAARSSRYSHLELKGLSFEKDLPDISVLSEKWHSMLAEAHGIIESLPSDEAGKCVLDAACNLYSGTDDQLRRDLAEGNISFHRGSIRGAFPEMIG